MHILRSSAGPPSRARAPYIPPSRAARSGDGHLRISCSSKGCVATATRREELALVRTPVLSARNGTRSQPRARARRCPLAAPEETHGPTWRGERVPRSWKKPRGRNVAAGLSSSARGRAAAHHLERRGEKQRRSSSPSRSPDRRAHRAHRARRSGRRESEPRAAPPRAASGGSRARAFSEGRNGRDARARARRRARASAVRQTRSRSAASRRRRRRRPSSRRGSGPCGARGSSGR